MHQLPETACQGCHSSIHVNKFQCVFPAEDENAPCDYCVRRQLSCIKVGAGRKLPEMKPPQFVDINNSSTVVSVSRSPSIVGYCPTGPQEEQAIRFLYDTIADSQYHHRHRELFRIIRSRCGAFIPNPCLRHAAITYSAYLQKRSELMESSWTSFHLEIKKLTRDTVDTDHMHSFLLMTHVSRRQGAWSSIT